MLDKRIILTGSTYGIGASVVNVLIIGTLVLRGGSDKRRRSKLVVTPSVPA